MLMLRGFGEVGEVGVGDARGVRRRGVESRSLCWYVAIS